MENTNKRFSNIFDTIEAFRFSFGQYKGKTLEEIKDNSDCVEYLKWYRKKIKKGFKNPKAKKYEAYNKRGLLEIENYLISIGEKIELTNFEEKVEENLKVDINNSKEKIEEDIEIDINNLEEKNFLELLNIMNESILLSFDEKVQNTKFIKKEYKDYLCLRFGRILYIELLEKQDKKTLIKIIQFLNKR